MGGVTALSEEAIAALLAPESRYGRGFAAFNPAGEIVGILRLANTKRRDVQEIAILVRSDQHRRGVGSVLMQAAWRIASAQGIRQLIAESSGANSAFAALARRFGLKGAWEPLDRVVRFTGLVPIESTSGM